MKFTFHRFNIPDTEDPDITAALPITEWQDTAKGQWVMENAHSLTWHRQPDSYQWGFDIIIRGEITDPHKITEYLLRWGQ
jgi:hypothetical protein